MGSQLNGVTAIQCPIEKVRLATEDGLSINKLVFNGLSVPTNLMLRVLRRAMVTSGHHNFLLDGFPRNAEQVKAAVAMIIANGYSGR